MLGTFILLTWRLEFEACGLWNQCLARRCHVSMKRQFSVKSCLWSQRRVWTRQTRLVTFLLPGWAHVSYSVIKLCVCLCVCVSVKWWILGFWGGRVLFSSLWLADAGTPIIKHICHVMEAQITRTTTQDGYSWSSLSPGVLQSLWTFLQVSSTSGLGDLPL